MAIRAEWKGNNGRCDGIQYELIIRTAIADQVLLTGDDVTDGDQRRTHPWYSRAFLITESRPRQVRLEEGEAKDEMGPTSHQLGAKSVHIYLTWVPAGGKCA